MIRCHLPRASLTARKARSLVRGAVAGEPEELCDLAVLLTNELVTNAIVHGEGDISLSLERCPHHLRIMVSDLTPEPPVRRPRDTDRENGRGIVIVEELAASWGVRRDKDGKSVWFELPLQT